MAENKNAEALPPPKLKGSRTRAIQKIKAQIQKGETIRDMFIGSWDDLEKAESEHDRWNAYNTRRFSQLFDDISIVDGYSDVRRIQTPFAEINQRIGEFRKNMDECIFYLDSVLDILELMPEPVQPSTTPAPSAQQAPLSREVFIVHGHDEAAKEGVARVLSQLDLKPIILNEKADAGQTVIEKFEKHANVAFAVVLLTPDDIGCAKKEPDQQKPRARQNVILEFGYFLGKLGRGKVCALYKEGVELPSDLYGILYVSMDASGAWKFRLAKEINQAGIKVDANVLLAD